MFRQLMKLAFLALIQVECQAKNLVWNLTTCDHVDDVTQAIGTTFFVTLISVCRRNVAGGCEVRYILLTTPEDQAKLPVPIEGPITNGREFLDGVTLEYASEIVDADYVTYNITMNSSVKSSAVNLKSQNLNNCGPAAVDLAFINFIGCRDPSRFHVAPHNLSRPIARYLDSGQITCHNGNTSGHAIYINGSKAITTQCLADARWRDADDIYCLYPINVTLNIEGDNYNETVTLHYNPTEKGSNEITLNCSAIVPTHTSEVKKFLLKDTLLDSPNITLHPKLNGENVSCYFENNYTKYFNGDNATYLSTSTLKITFDPISPNDDPFCSFSNGSIKFYSNPPADEISLTLLKGNEKIPSQIADCCGMQYGVVGQMITPLNNSTANENLTLRANYSGHLTFYNVTPCESVSITTGTDSSPNSGSGFGSDKTDLSVIILACAGGILILIVIGLILICRRRNNKGNGTSGGDKVENVNPLYGTSDDVALETTPDEQVVNPLYGTTDGETEVYAEVDKKNKKGKAKKPQKTTKGNEELYASVDKGKGKTKGKENSGYEADDKADSTYSVVDKKKKGAQKANDSTTADVDTYAVVDRTNKKRKGAGADDLHGSTVQ